jgi:hypothetical protein
MAVAGSVRTTSPRRVVAALAVGAIIPGVLTGFLLTAPGWLTFLLTGVGPGWKTGIAVTSLAILAATAAFASGLLLVAAPAWWVAHRLGWREAWHGALLGAVLAGGVFFAIWTYPHGWGPPQGVRAEVWIGDEARVVDSRLTPAGWRSAASMAFFVAWVGGAGGAALWWAAYRPDRGLA